MSVSSLYMFRGFQFIDYVDVPTFKDNLVENGIEVTDFEDVKDFFEQLHNSNPKKLSNANKALFENVLYSHLKNVYVCELNQQKLDTKTFKKRVETVLKAINDKPNIPSDVREVSIKPESFYLLDSFGITQLGTRFIAGFDFEQRENQVTSARFMFVEVVRRKDRSSRYYNGYFIAGVEIDLEHNYALILIRGIADIVKNANDADDEAVSGEGDDIDDMDDGGFSEISNTVTRLYKEVKDRLIGALGLHVTIDGRNDQRAMYAMCEDYDKALLDDWRDDISFRTDDYIKTITDDLFEKLKEMSGEDKSSITEKDLFARNVKALLLSAYIGSQFTPLQIARYAKQKGLKGYLTRIAYNGNRLTRGATKSGSAKAPVAKSDIYHNLYTSFTDSKALKVCALSWFTDYKALNENDVEVFQTAIYCYLKYLKVVFLNDRPTGKEMLYHVISEITRYRQAKF